MSVRGKVVKYGRNVDTDVIIPARYLNTSDPAELAAHCMEDIDKSFTSRDPEINIMTALDNFGSGSSREHAPIALKGSGISCVIASNFARIFYRNAVNTGLAIVECPAAAEEFNSGDEAGVDFENGVVYNYTKNKKYSFEPFPEFIQRIISAGGLIKAAEKGLLRKNP